MSALAFGVGSDWQGGGGGRNVRVLDVLVNRFCLCISEDTDTRFSLCADVKTPFERQSAGRHTRAGHPCQRRMVSGSGSGSGYACADE